MSVSFHRSFRAIFRQGTFLLLALVVACGSKPTTCKINGDCGQGASCVKGVCVPQLTGLTLGVEISPPSDSLSARTEFLAVDLSEQPIALSADDNVAVQGMATFPTGMTPIYPSQEAHVSVTIPSRIPLRDPLLILTEMAKAQFAFNVPKTRLDTGVVAKLLFLPGTAVQIQPPVNLSAPLTAMLNVTFPDPGDMTKISGRFVTTSGAPLSGYLARATYQSDQISNIVTTMSMTNDGSFRLSIPPGAIPPGADDAVSLTIAPLDSQDNVAQFVTVPVSLATLAASTTDIPHVYVMPDLLPAQTFTTSVTTATGEALANVTAYFHGEVPALPDGTATFDVSAVSQANGSITVQLIPGTVMAPVVYDVFFRGPADPTYKYASQCNRGVAVSVTDAGLPSPISGAMLTPKFSLSGSVSDSTAAPAIGATVTATPIAGTPSCAGIAPSSASAISGDSGFYFMLVDPGTTYSLDVAPPTKASWPRLAQLPQVTVPHDTVYNISLPAGRVVEGHITTSDTVTSLPLANITVFQVFCQSTPCDDPRPPLAIAQTQTDMNGMFTTVLPPLQ